MKLKKYFYATVLLLISTTTAHAQFLPGKTIVSMHMTPTGGTVYATFDAPIGYIDCPGARSIGIATTAARFEEIYAQLLRAQAAQTLVEVRDSYVNASCNSSGSTILLPYLRFLSQ